MTNEIDNQEFVTVVEDDTEDLQAAPTEARPELEPDECEALVEALIFAAGEPLSVERICSISKLSVEQVQEIIARLTERYLAATSGLELVCVAESYQFRTKNLYSPFIRELRAGRPRRLSAQALETLAIVAYRQPIVKSDIEKIRGVDATPTLKTLLERRLIRIAGHQATVGQPALYGTTDEFLKLFGLKSLGELPTLRDLKEIDGDPGESSEQLNLIDGNSSDAIEAEQVSS